MKKAVFAVCDAEEEYAAMFMEYLHEHKKMVAPFLIQVFTSTESLLAYASENAVEILLISEKAVNEAVRSLPVSRLIILTEGQERDGPEAYPKVYKYQASGQIVREVLDCYGAEKLARFTPVRLRTGQKIIGVYSPSGYSQKMLFAMALGQVLARKTPVLYVNLDSYSGLSGILRASGSRGLSDLLYLYRRGRALAPPHLDGMLCPLRAMDCLLPAVTPADLQDMGSEEWLGFLEELMRVGNYGALIADAGNALRDLPEMLSGCAETWVPLQADVLSAACMKQFEDTVREAYPDLPGKMRRVYPPLLKLASADRKMLEGLEDGELGACVRKAL